jgi:ATP-dependent helicase STH1/SNF2
MTIGLFAYLMESKHVPGPFLIIAPLSTQKNWISEFAKWCPLIRVVPYGGSKDVRTMLWKTSLKPGSYNVVLTSFEYIMNKHDRGKLGNVQWK